MRSIVFAFLGVTWGVPRALTAQVNFEVVLPYAGIYLPTQKLLDHAPSGFCTCSLKQKTAVTLGGRLTMRWTSRLGAEVTVGYSPSGLSTVGARPADSSGQVITASVRVLRQMGPTSRSPWLRLGGGVGFVSRSGGAYKEASTSLTSVCGTSGFTGVLSAGIGFKLGQGGLVLRLDAENYMYRSGLYVQGEYPGCGSYTQSQCRGLGQVCNYFETASPTNRFQNDLVLSLGLAIAARD